MIKLIIDEWCDHCNKFEPMVDVIDNSQVMHDFRCGKITVRYDCNTIVRCTNAQRCADIKRYIESQNKKDANNGKTA